LVIPYRFVRQHVELTWREIVYGIENGIFAPASAVEHAIAKLGSADEYSQSLVDLASLSKSESIHPYVDELADAEPEELVDDIQAKWLYLTLSWLYDQKDTFADPLQVVELVYADFGYPEAMAPFVRYMPSQDPDLGSLEQNEARLYQKWRNYLVEQSERYSRVTEISAN